MIKFLDTNIILNGEFLENPFGEKFMISSETFKELENIKSSSNKSDEIKAKARAAVRFLSQCEDSYDMVIVRDEHYGILKEFRMPVSPDNLIIACAFDYNENVERVIFVSNDVLCRIIAATIFGLDVQCYENGNEEEYIGYKEITLNDEEMAKFYSNLNKNEFECLLNEYLVIRDSGGDVVDRRRWDGKSFAPLKFRQINNDYTGKIKPRNLQQEMAFDLLQNDDIRIKLLLGKFGSGKTMLMVSTAIQFLKTKKYDKVMWVRNNIEVKHTKEIGFLPGKKNDKLICYAMPLADHCGGQYGLEMFMNSGEIELEHLGHLRGRDIKNTLILCSEAENMTKEHVQLLIGRIGENSSLWLDGDLRQIDHKTFEENNGISALISGLKGNKYFGFVKLQKTERSDVADLADLLN